MDMNMTLVVMDLVQEVSAPMLARMVKRIEAKKQTYRKKGSR
jgi:hypothetical protein